MGRGIHVFKIFGINIDIDWSWIFIFLLITFNLVFGVFPALHPDWSFILSLTVGVAASILFFASVLAHEIAHSLVARSRGIPVNRITLFLLGGVSNIEREPTSPGTEFYMALVGPLTSVLLGIFFILLGAVFTGSPGNILFNPGSSLAKLNPISTLLVWLGPVNILVGLFNLIPGFPLDGGRILRSIIWAINKNLEKATYYASQAGRAVAWLFIVTGILMIFGIPVPIFGTGIFGGIWLIFIGIFLNSAAGQSYERLVVESVLEKVKVSDLMRKNMPTVSPDISVSDLVHKHIMGTDERAFPVLKNSHLVGLVSLEDVRQVPNNEWQEKRVEQIMTPDKELKIVSPNENAAQALHKIISYNIGQLPVIKDGKLVGILRMKDILLWFQLHSPKNQ